VAGESDSEQPLRRSLAALVTVCVAALTLAGAFAAYLQARSNAQARRASLTADIRAQALDTVGATIRLTSDLAASVGAEWGAHTAIFAAVARNIEREPGINGVGLMEAVGATQRTGFERRHGPIELRTPQGALRSAPPRAEYYVVLDSTRRGGGPSAVGLDVGTERTRLATLLAAARSGRPRATQPVSLMIGGAGTVLYVPVYRPSPLALRTASERLRALRGFVSIGYSYDLLGPALQRASPAGTAFRLADGHVRLVSQGTPLHPAATQLAVAGRTWTLTVGEPAPDLSLAVTILLVGLLGTLLVGTFGVQAWRRERYAQALVARRLAEREVAEQELARDRRRHESELQYMADHDPLTGLLNRRAFERSLEEHLARGERYGHEGAVLVVDLDDFKGVNDTLGHSAGDELIGRVAGALASRLRESDTLARLGGDEFAVLTPVGDRAEAERLAQLLLGVVRREHAARGPGGRERPITASIGLAPLEGAQPIRAEEALINADLAMYDAKEAGRDRSETYGGTSRGQARIEARLQWVERIRAALDEDRLVLYAQPVVETATGRTTQHELLVRMVDTRGEVILPGSFLPIAERFGLIREIDRWVVTHAIRWLGEHRAQGRRPTVELNLSAHSLGDPQLAAHIGRELRAAGVHATQLIFEVTETTAIGNITAARAFAERLGELGCRFALDDFGAGFGSFYYLKHLPFDFIKIDGEFVRNCTSDPTDRLVIGAVVELARGLGKRTIAEFVGDAATLATLRYLGVDYAQGFHLGSPMPLEHALDLASERHS
jgi:diguanylate cyclase (GGDEF)-like protein